VACFVARAFLSTAFRLGIDARRNANSTVISLSSSEWGLVSSVIIATLLIATVVGKVGRRPVATCMLTSIDKSKPTWLRAMDHQTVPQKIATYRAITPSHKKERQRVWRLTCALSAPGWSAVLLLTILAGFAVATASGVLAGNFGTLFVAALLGGVLSTLLVGEPTALRDRYGHALFDSLSTALKRGHYTEKLARLNSDRSPVIGIDELMRQSRDDALVRVLYLLLLRE
jgi:hypothetical protein